MTLNDKLLNAFQPVVENALRACLAKTTFAITEIENKALAHIFTLDVTLPHKVTAATIKEIAERLDTFCVCEDQARMIDGVKWELGDGDDSGAVVFHDNAFHVWVRSFK